MRSHVQRQTERHPKGFSANLTAMRLLARMDTFVLDLLVRPGERFAAVRAQERQRRIAAIVLPIRSLLMSSFVHLQQNRRFKCDIARDATMLCGSFGGVVGFFMHRLEGDRIAFVAFVAEEFRRIIAIIILVHKGSHNWWTKVFRRGHFVCEL